MTDDQKKKVHSWKEIAKITLWDEQPPEDTLPMYIIAIMTAYAAMNKVAQLTNMNPREIYPFYLTASVIKLARHTSSQECQEVLHSWLSEKVFDDNVASIYEDGLMAMMVVPTPDNQTN